MGTEWLGWVGFVWQREDGLEQFTSVITNNIVNASVLVHVLTLTCACAAHTLACLS